MWQPILKSHRNLIIRDVFDFLSPFVGKCRRHMIVFSKDTSSRIVLGRHRTLSSSRAGITLLNLFLGLLNRLKKVLSWINVFIGFWISLLHRLEVGFLRVNSHLRCWNLLRFSLLHISDLYDLTNSYALVFFILWCVIFVIGDVFDKVVERVYLGPKPLLQFLLLGFVSKFTRFSYEPKSLVTLKLLEKDFLFWKFVLTVWIPNLDVWHIFDKC